MLGLTFSLGVSVVQVPILFCSNSCGEDVSESLGLETCVEVSKICALRANLGWICALLANLGRICALLANLDALKRFALSGPDLRSPCKSRPHLR